MIIRFKNLVLETTAKNLTASYHPGTGHFQKS